MIYTCIISLSCHISADISRLDDLHGSIEMLNKVQRCCKMPETCGILNATVEDELLVLR